MENTRTGRETRRAKRLAFLRAAISGTASPSTSTSASVTARARKIHALPGASRWAKPTAAAVAEDVRQGRCRR